MAYEPQHILFGAGTLYAAPLGTTEPTSVTGAWPSGWVEIGYTPKGSTFNVKPTVADQDVEESYWPARKVVTKLDADLTFEMAETTQQNWILSMNGGIGSSTLSGISGTNTDGSVWAEVPTIGSEVRVMLGWDSNPMGSAAEYAVQRLICRQCFQTGQVKRAAQKGANFSTFAATFSLELPNTGLQPFRLIWPASEVS